MKKLWILIFAVPLVGTVNPTGKFELISTFPNQQVEHQMFGSITDCDAAKGLFLKKYEKANSSTIAEYRAMPEEDRISWTDLKLASAACVPDDQL